MTTKGIRLLLWLSLLSLSSLACPQPPHVQLPAYRLQAEQLAIIVNLDDPLSVQIAEYYREQRNIPQQNLIQVRMNPRRGRLSQEEFAPVYASIREQTPEHIQAYALSWVFPYRVDCMSITTAIAAGPDRGWCSARQCAPTRLQPWYNHDSLQPTATGLRPAMSIAAETFADAKALIDRGVQADDSWPNGRAYLLSTSDKARNVRARGFAASARSLAPRLPVLILQQDSLRDRDDVLFYFTGTKQVEALDTLNFIPGAVADHLTSAGGHLRGKRQMSALRWLQAGASGSYGTVIEPCNLPAKFPHPGYLMQRYLNGATLIEAYWKSVAMPGEGLFIGDPLVSPFGGYRLHEVEHGWQLTSYALAPGRYRLASADDAYGKFTDTGLTYEIRKRGEVILLPRTEQRFFRLEALD